MKNGFHINRTNDKWKDEELCAACCIYATKERDYFITLQLAINDGNILRIAKERIQGNARRTKNTKFKTELFWELFNAKRVVESDGSGVVLVYQTLQHS